jgi:hypothetical protein
VLFKIEKQKKAKRPAAGGNLLRRDFLCCMQKDGKEMGASKPDKEDTAMKKRDFLITLRRFGNMLVIQRDKPGKSEGKILIM